MTTAKKRSLKGLSTFAAVAIVTLALASTPLSASEVAGAAAWSESPFEIGSDGQDQAVSVQFQARITEEDESQLRVDLMERDVVDGHGDTLVEIDVPAMAEAGNLVDVTMAFTLRGSSDPQESLSAGTVTSITIRDGADGRLLAEYHEQPGRPIGGVSIDHPGSANEAIWEVQLVGDQRTASTAMEVVREGTPQFVRGDIDSDGQINGLFDALALLRFSFTGGDAPDCLAAADVDGDDTVHGLRDALYLINYSFNSGDAPAAPFPACGLNRSTALSCEGSDACE
jgi:hypothetical protein